MQSGAIPVLEGQIQTVCATGRPRFQLGFHFTLGELPILVGVIALLLFPRGLLQKRYHQRK